MGGIEKAIRTLERNPKGIKFSELSKILDEWFGEPRKRGSHRIYRTPWQGDPRVNIQNDNGMAKAYQVRQVIKAPERLAEQGDAECVDSRGAGSPKPQLR